MGIQGRGRGRTTQRRLVGKAEKGGPSLRLGISVPLVWLHFTTGDNKQSTTVLLLLEGVALALHNLQANKHQCEPANMSARLLYPGKSLRGLEGEAELPTLVPESICQPQFQTTNAGALHAKAGLLGISWDKATPRDKQVSRRASVRVVDYLYGRR